jgi:hypothetical protein
MKIHARFFLVQRAEVELGLAISEFMLKQDKAEPLTQVEWLQVLNNVMNKELGHVIKYMIREERHGNQETPGDAAG